MTVDEYLKKAAGDYAIGMTYPMTAT